MPPSNLCKPLPSLNTDDEKTPSSPYNDDSDPSELTSFLPSSHTETTQHENSPHPRQRKPRTILTHPLTLIYASLTTLLALNTLVLFLTLRHQSPSPSPGSQPATSSLSSTIPWYPFPNTTLFRPHPNYESFADKFDALWSGMQTPNGGFFIKELDSSSTDGPDAEEGLGRRGAKRANVETTNRESTKERRHGGKEGKERHTFGIAMFHQLHCLGYLRNALKVLDGVARGVAVREGVEFEDTRRSPNRDANKDGEENGEEGDGEEGLEEQLRKLVAYQDRFGVTQCGRWDAVHVGHCVDYIRQSILCAADATIEPPGTLDIPDSLDIISGHDVLHQCRDANAVWDMSVQSGWVDEEVHPEEVVKSPFGGRI